MSRLNRLSQLAAALGLVIAQSGSFAATSPASVDTSPQPAAPRLEIRFDVKRAPSVVAMKMSDQQSPMCTYLKGKCADGSEYHCQGYLDNCK